MDIHKPNQQWAATLSIVGLLCSFSQHLDAKVARAHVVSRFRPNLEWDAALAQLAVTPGVGAVAFDGSKVITVDRNADRYLLASFTPIGPTDKQAAKDPKADPKVDDGPFGDSESRPFTADVAGTRRFMGVVPFVRSTLLFLESTDSRIVAVESASGFFVSQRAIVLDKLKPARDSRGEPTNLETATFRQHFMKAFGHINDGTIKLSGLAALPPAWHDGDAHQFLVASRIPGYMLMTMHCLEAELSQCRIVRGCFAEGIGSILPDSVTGVAVSAERRLVLVGDRHRAQLIVFRFESCHNIVKVGEIPLPIQLKELGNVMIDSDDRLWVSTLLPDDYRNANVFVWDSKHW